MTGFVDAFGGGAAFVWGGEGGRLDGFTADGGTTSVVGDDGRLPLRVLAEPPLTVPPVVTGLGVV